MIGPKYQETSAFFLFYQAAIPARGKNPLDSISFSFTQFVL
jgi:hypothetical protein